MSRVVRSRANFHHSIDSDFSINSANDENGKFGQDEKKFIGSAAHVLDVEEDHEHVRYGDRGAMEHRHMPLKSTLLNDQRPGGSESKRLKQSRNRIPDAFLFAEMEPKKQNSRSASNMPIESKLNRFDATLSTQRSDSLLDDMRHQDIQRLHKHPSNLNNEDSLIMGVGQGHQRRRGGGGGALNAMRDGLYQSNFAHPSPATAARHDHLRHKSVLSQPKYDDSKAESSDESESAVESSSSSIGGANNADPFNVKRSLGESTGNHQGFMKSPQITKNVEAPTRPKLPSGWQERLDEVNGHKAVGGGGKGKRETASPFRAINHIANRASAATHLYGELCDQARPPRSDSASNESGFAAGSQRKPSSASSKGKDAEGSTSGATLVETHANGGYGSHFRLPSGRKMGKGIPSSGFSLPVDLSGITAALESPVKTRVGVEHRQITPETVQAFAAATSHDREQQLETLATYIKNIEDKVERVEDVSNEFANELGTLRNEWKSWKQVHADPVTRKERKGVKSSRANVQPTQDHNEYDEDATKRFRSKLINAFHLVSDIGQSMEDYRSTLIELRKEEKDLLARESMRSKRALQSEQMQDLEADKNEDDLDSLRTQVDAVSREVERLKVIVERKPNIKKGYSASSPIKPSSRFRSTMNAACENPFVQRRKVSAEARENAAHHQKAFDGLGEAPRSHSGTHKDHEKHNIHGYHHSHDVEDVSMMAEERAERASEKVVEARSIAHDLQNCTCCARQSENKRRKDARKQMAIQEWKGFDQRTNKSQAQSAMHNFQEDESSARALLEEAMMELEQYVGSRLPPALIQLANRQKSLLERMIKEEMDEFYHAKRTYCDLADELKSFSPDISLANRRILADHVLVAVEGLELRANRIDRLRAALAAALPGSVLEEIDDDQDAEDDDSIQKRTRKHVSRPRNSPPIVDQANIHTNKVNAYSQFDY